LIKQADVLVENFRPGVMQRLELDFAQLHRANPRIVHCSISGYGATGPLSRKKSYDLMVQAVSGLMSITGEPDGDVCKAGSPLSDGIAGTYAVAGILAALLQRFRTGCGQFVDVSMLDCLFSLLFDEPLDCYESLGLPLRQGNRIMRFSPFNCYPTRDGAIVIGTGSEEDWLQLLGVVGREDLAKDANYMDRGWRVANNDIIDKIVTVWTRQHTKASALSELDRRDIPCAPVNDVTDILKSSQLLNREMLQPLRSPSLQDVSAVLAPGFPIKFSAADTEYGAATMPRANNEEIFSGLLQLSQAEIEELQRAGVI
jgi:crotonobetainyl-CoA:carnitine CoA-transferase CaiB-like acyl-CoA transferase